MKKSIFLVFILISNLVIAQNDKTYPIISNMSNNDYLLGVTSNSATGIRISKSNFIANLGAGGVDSVKRKVASDSVFWYKGGTKYFAYKDSTGNGWSTTGNAGTDPASNFIGTTDGAPLIFSQNNSPSGKLSSDSNWVYFGTATGSGSIGNNIVGLGAFSLTGSVGSNIIAIGQGTAQSMTGTGNVIAIGNLNTASGNSGSNVIGIGDLSIASNSGKNVIALGYAAANSNNRDHVIAIGDSAAYQNGSNDIVAIGHLAGYNNSGNNVTAIGDFSGYNNFSNPNDTYFTGIGFNTNTLGNSIDRSTAIGANALVNCSNCGVLGDTDRVSQWGIGYSTPSAILGANTGLAINGKIALTDGTQGANKILTSNVNGVASWQANAAPTISSGVVAPASTPTKLGDEFIDTVLKKVYIATGTSSSADWTIIN